MKNESADLLIMNHYEKKKLQQKRKTVDFLLDGLTLQGCLT